MDVPKITLHHLDEVTSTNDEARRLAEAGAPDGTLVWADHQSQGRGRYGRTWHSSPGDNILLSWILRPAAPLDRLGVITMMGAVAVAESLAAIAEVPARIKWPNDVLIRGRKVSGMLLESAQDAANGSSARFVILGIGINVNQRSFPRDLRNPATSLILETGERFPRRVVVDELTRRLIPLYTSILSDGATAVHARYMDLLDGLGQPLTLHLRGSSAAVSGRLERVAPDGGLELTLRDGGRRTYYAGEVSTDPTAFFRQT